MSRTPSWRLKSLQFVHVYRETGGGAIDLDDSTWSEPSRLSRLESFTTLYNNIHDVLDLLYIYTGRVSVSCSTSMIITTVPSAAMNLMRLFHLRRELYIVECNLDPGLPQRK